MYEKSIFISQNEGGELAKKENIQFLVGDINSFESEIREVHPDLIILCTTNFKNTEYS